MKVSGRFQGATLQHFGVKARLTAPRPLTVELPVPDLKRSDPTSLDKMTSSLYQQIKILGVRVLG